MHRRLLLVPIALVAVASLFVTSAADASTAGGNGTDGGSGKGGSSSSSTSSGRRTYIVRSGDSVQSVAKRTGVSADDVRAANGIVDDRLYLGAQLLIDPSAAADGSTGSSGSAPTSSRPSSSSGSASSVTPMTTIRSATYKVRKGDALVRIARKHGVSLSALLAANDLDTDSLILPGDKLVIPSGSSKVSTSTKGSTSSTTSGSRAVSSGRSAGSTGPDIRCPVPGATFMNDWGFPRDGGSRFHQGTDMFAPKGTTIVAPASGTIVYGSNKLGGSTFNLTTDSGWVIYGAHLSATIGSSRRVTAGQAIARVGNSGDALGGDTHLHIGIKRVGGQPQNPYPAVLRACR